MIMNNRPCNAITLHDALHGFRQGTGTRTATMEANLAHKLTVIVHEPLYQVFIDVQKAYDYLDRGR